MADFKAEVRLEVDEYNFNLGSYHRKVTTNSPDSQKWFDRGLIWSYAFNHDEAAECFKHAISHDPECAMAYWGYAYVIGPNYNKPWDVFGDEERKEAAAQAHQAAITAKAKAEAASPVEQALVEALQLRYPENQASDTSKWNESYAEAMGSVYEKFQDDLDVAALYAEALMNLTPWGLWDIKTGEPAPDARTLEAKQILERALDQSTVHPGLLHLYIHLMEMSNNPEAALPAADHLRGLVPDAGHLEHMPTHIDVLCGDYQSVITSNSNAILADDKFFLHYPQTSFYTLYRIHNHHFLIYGALFAAQRSIALSTCTTLEACLPPSLLQIQTPPMADWLEGFLSIRIHVLIRFGLWNDLLALPLPSDQTLYCVTTAMTHYGRGIAFASTKQIPLALHEQVLFHLALARVPDTRTLFNNKCIDILKIAGAMLAGEILYRNFSTSDELETAFQYLRTAVQLSDALPYDEPWGWMQPPRHALGALLLEQGRVVEARGVYVEDLGEPRERSELSESELEGVGVDVGRKGKEVPRALRHKDNIWALCGLYECLVILGDGDGDGDGGKVGRGYLEEVRGRLEKAKRGADVEVGSSCFCRRGVEGR